MAMRNEGFERLKRIIASKEEEEEEPPDEARRKVDECLFGENSYNEIFYKTLLGMRGELMDYLDSNPEDDSLTATIRSAIVGVTQAEEVYEMMVEMNRIGFEDSDCEDQEEHLSTCVDSGISETNEEPAEAEKLLPSFSIAEEVVIDHTLMPEADEIIDDMSLAVHEAKKLREYIIELRAEDDVRIEERINPGSMSGETTEELKVDCGVIRDSEELTPKVHISEAANRDPPFIPGCVEEPIIEGRVFDVGKETRPVEPDKESIFEAQQAILCEEIPVHLGILPGMEESYDSKPIKPGKDPGKSSNPAQDFEKARGDNNLNLLDRELSKNDKPVSSEALNESENSSAKASELPKDDLSHESVRINSGKDPGGLPKPPQDGGKERESSCLPVMEVREVSRETEKSDTPEWKPQKSTKPASTYHPCEIERFSANPHVLQKIEVNHVSVPINSGKDPGVQEHMEFDDVQTSYGDDGNAETKTLGTKSGGGPLVSNKQLRPGWDPPKTNFHVRIFEKSKDTAVGETKLEGSLTDGISPSNGKTRRDDVLNIAGSLSSNPGKKPEKPLRPPHKLKEKINSKCSRAWKVKDPNVKEAWTMKNKSGGRALTPNKQFKRGWDPPAIHSF